MRTMRALILSFAALAAGCDQTDVLDRQYIGGRLLVRACEGASTRRYASCFVRWNLRRGSKFNAVGPVTIAWGRPLYVGHIEESPDVDRTYEVVVWGNRAGKHYRQITRGPFFHGEKPLYTARLDSGHDEDAEVVVWGVDELNRESFCRLDSFEMFDGGLRYSGVPYEPTGSKSSCSNDRVTRTWFVESNRLVLR